MLPFVFKRASFPPFGLLTVATLLPAEWDLRLADLNVEPLSDNDLHCADYVMLSAMIVHKPVVAGLVERCRTISVVWLLVCEARPARYDLFVRSRPAVAGALGLAAWSRTCWMWTSTCLRKEGETA